MRLRGVSIAPVATWLLGSLAAAILLFEPVRAQTTTRVSLTSAGAQATGLSDEPHLSADGRWVLFSSEAEDLVPGDTNGLRDVFVRERKTGVIERVNVGPHGVQADKYSYGIALSADGHYAVLASNATNLVSGPANCCIDVFVRDRWMGVTEIISLSSMGAAGNGPSENGAISARGRFVAFTSSATNLVPGDMNGHSDVFVRDRLLGLTTLVSVSSSGSLGNDHSFHPVISGDGSLVAFRSYATNLVPGDTNGRDDIFVHDLLSGTTRRVSVDSSGNQANGNSYQPRLSGNGRYAAFSSRAGNLVPGDTNGSEDVFVHDLVTGATTRVSLATTGSQGNDDSELPALSWDGRYVALASNATDLVPGDTNGAPDVFVHDRLTGETTRISVSSSGLQGNAQSGLLSWTGIYWNILGLDISADGRIVTFGSLASNLVPDDGNGEPDVFVHDRLGCSPTVGTYCIASATSLPGCRAHVQAQGLPSLTAPARFRILSGPIPGSSRGGACFGFHGPSFVPFGTQGGLLCVAAPRYFAGYQPAGGSAASCDGHLIVNLADLVAAKPHLFQAGSTVHVAIWFRDPGSPDGVSTSDGLWFDVCP